MCIESTSNNILPLPKVQYNYGSVYQKTDTNSTSNQLNQSYFSSEINFSFSSYIIVR